ncbi:hypothetical protein [Microbacterium capsulatum]|uniref:DUF1579 domain-containing protein n=1 Tax=Microbacterium capsulatum TaxID=3041921 RepID=A0ABU0XIG9_9MICO|nr:hypothetical protein [Microbacterium sp. ASV81]MDQ4214922.1 hypothetical protein [Microbacterium sp. ASV81]
MAPDRRLIALLGDWTGTEELFATGWTEAGSARGALTVEPGPDGILLDYVEQREGADPLVAHGVIAGTGFWWFDTYGFTPAAPGTALWEDDALVLDRRSERGRTVMRLRADGDGLALELDTAVPADADPIPLVRGTYTRSGS